MLLRTFKAPHSRRVYQIAAPIVIALTLALSACGGTQPGTNTNTVAAAELPANQCNKSTGLTVYSAQGYDSDSVKAFQLQTGVKTKLVDDSTGPLLARVATEGANPQWDVAWFDGNVTMQDLDNKGFLLKWKSGNLGNYNSQGAGLVPSDYSYYPGGLTAAGVIVYNTTHAPAVLPQTWSDLLKPQYKGMMAENDPAFSGPAFPFISGVSQVLGG